MRTNVPTGDYSTVNVEITIGSSSTADRLTGSVNLVEQPPGSGRWQEP